MSELRWDTYVSAMVTGIPEGAAAIYGRSPSSVWFESPGFPITAQQVADLISFLTNPESKTSFSVGDKRFLKLQCEAGVIVRGKSSEHAAAAAFSDKAILVCYGKTNPQNVGAVVEKYANDLRAKGF